MSFPPLPPSTGSPWGPIVNRAYLSIKDTYESARAVARQEETDPLRLKTWADSLADRQRLVRVLEREGLPAAWIQTVSNQLDALSGQIRQAMQASVGRYAFHFISTQLFAHRHALQFQ